tara:strand:- start:22038 stop:22514 length:477 start_codon:yes stop_codon:yes gene_type:complete
MTRDLTAIPKIADDLSPELIKNEEDAKIAERYAEVLSIYYDESNKNGHRTYNLEKEVIKFIKLHGDLQRIATHLGHPRNSLKLAMDKEYIKYNSDLDTSVEETFYFEPEELEDMEKRQYDYNLEMKIIECMELAEKQRLLNIEKQYNSQVDDFNDLLS